VPKKLAALKAAISLKWLPAQNGFTGQPKDGVACGSKWTVANCGGLWLRLTCLKTLKAKIR
jgi:hypothetical protein